MLNSCRRSQNQMANPGSTSEFVHPSYIQTGLLLLPMVTPPSRFQMQGSGAPTRTCGSNAPLSYGCPLSEREHTSTFNRSTCSMLIDVNGLNNIIDC